VMLWFLGVLFVMLCLLMRMCLLLMFLSLVSMCSDVVLL